MTEDEIAALLSHIDALARERDATVLAEREACAALCHQIAWQRRVLMLPNRAADECAAAIRARSTPAPVQP